jgi:radical SAM protein with 4Fe4S-binding SPASM domain
MHRSGPDYIQFYPTFRCDRSCGFCFNRTMPPVPDMSLENFKRMLPVLKPLHVTTIDIIGGEPTMHPDIILMVRDAVQQGFCVNVSSNGADPVVLAELCGMGRNVTVGISINDRKTLGQLSDFIRSGGPVVKTVFTAQTDQALIQDILALKPKKFYLIYRDIISPRELTESIPFPLYVNTLDQKYNSSEVSKVYCSGFLPDENYPQLARVRCPAGTTKLGVMPDGSVYPCNLFFGRPEFHLGNILADSFDAIWNHQALTFFRTFTENVCTQRSCAFRARCHGGCPAQALILSGELAAPDPRCHPAARADL